MLIRPYTEDDWPAVRAIHDLCKPDECRGSVDPRAILPLERDIPALGVFSRSRIVVAVESDDLAGFAGTIGSYISWLCVHPAHRRRGVATRLLQSVLDDVTRPATLNVFARNQPARRLYERSGFVVDEEFVGNFNGLPVDVVRLRLDGNATVATR